MIKKSRFKDYIKKLNNEEFNKTLEHIDKLIIENKEYCDKNNYEYLCNLFSSLALVFMLIDYGYDKGKAQDIVFDAIYKYLEPTVPKMQKLASQKWFVLMLKKLMSIKFKCGYGWKITYPKTNKNEFTMITHKCIFKEIFTKYNMPNLTVGFCKVDNLLYDNLPNTTFSYNERIGEGGNVCDYTFKRNK